VKVTAGNDPKNRMNTIFVIGANFTKLGHTMYLDVRLLRHDKTQCNKFEQKRKIVKCMFVFKIKLN